LADPDTARSELHRKALRKGIDLDVSNSRRPLTDAVRLIGRDSFLDYVYVAVLNEDESARTWWETYQALSQYDRDTYSLEALCLLAEVPPDRVFGAAMAAGLQLGARMSDLVYGMHQAGMVRRLVDSASFVSHDPATNSRDRQLFLQHGGFLPTSSGGPTITVQATASAKAASVTTTPGLPSFLEDVLSVRPEAKALPPHDEDA
jgi:hypothetical protein